MNGEKVTRKKNMFDVFLFANDFRLQSIFGAKNILSKLFPMIKQFW